MTDEIQATGTVQIDKNNLSWRNTLTQFKDDMSGTEKGPTPGSITVTTAGVDVDLSELTVPGYCFIQNQGSNTLHYGTHDGTNFHPLGEVRAGKFNFITFSSLFGDVLTDTGTGDAGNTTFRMLAENQSTNAFVAAFEA